MYIVLLAAMVELLPSAGSYTLWRWDGSCLEPIQMAVYMSSWYETDSVVARERKSNPQLSETGWNWTKSSATRAIEKMRLCKTRLQYFGKPFGSKHRFSFQRNVRPPKTPDKVLARQLVHFPNRGLSRKENKWLGGPELMSSKWVSQVTAQITFSILVAHTHHSTTYQWKCISF